MSSVKTMDIKQREEVPAPPIVRLDPPTRLLLGPGPSNAHPRIYTTLGTPQVGHLDPSFLTIVEELKALLRYVWQTDNAFTIPVSGTGSAAMEAAICNMVSPGTRFLACINGYFGERMCDMASRYDADVRRIEKPWGTIFTLAELRAALEKHRPQVLGIVHAETSTGACQHLEGVGDLCREFDCLLLVDTVTSIGGVPLFLDKWKVDVCYAGTQKCLACPPGVAPLSFGPRAMARLAERKGANKVKNWYLDMTMIARYLAVSGGAPRTYHHTAPISMIYAMREALSLIAEETLPKCWARHRATAELFWAALDDMGLKCLVPYENRLPSLTTVIIPEGIDGKRLVTHLREVYSIEIGNGMGALAGKCWRIGLMGYNSRPENVAVLVTALRAGLAEQGYKVPAPTLGAVRSRL